MSVQEREYPKFLVLDPFWKGNPWSSLGGSPRPEQGYLQRGRGYPTQPHETRSACLCGAGGMPLALTQEDFLVHMSVCMCRYILKVYFCCRVDLRSCHFTKTMEKDGTVLRNLSNGADVSIICCVPPEGADVDQALIIAAELGHVNCVEILIRLGADVNTNEGTKQGTSALMNAANVDLIIVSHF